MDRESDGRPLWVGSAPGSYFVRYVYILLPRTGYLRDNRLGGGEEAHYSAIFCGFFGVGNEYQHNEKSIVIFLTDQQASTHQRNEAFRTI